MKVFLSYTMHTYLQKYLADLYLLIFGDETQKLPKGLLSKNWLEIGFLTKNPRLEFRSGGILALHCIRYFIKKYPEVF